LWPSDEFLTDLTKNLTARSHWSLGGLLVRLIHRREVWPPKHVGTGPPSLRRAVTNVTTTQCTNFILSVMWHKCVTVRRSSTTISLYRLLGLLKRKIYRCIVSWSTSACRLLIQSQQSFSKVNFHPCLLNPLHPRDNYSATSNNTKLVHWPLMGGC